MSDITPPKKDISTILVVVLGVVMVATVAGMTFVTATAISKKKKIDENDGGTNS